MGHKSGLGYVLLRGLSQEIPELMVNLALIRVSQYCVRPQWWMCMHIFQHTAVGVIRPNPIRRARSVCRGDFHLHIFVILF